MKPVDEFLNHRYAILLENGGYVPETETDVSTRVHVYMLSNFNYYLLNRILITAKK